MTPCRLLRPVLLGVAGLATASCGMVDSDPRRFETMAQAVADIPVDDPRSALREGLRPAAAPAPAAPSRLKVEVMDPHALWDARDAGLRGALEQSGPAMIQAAAPTVAQAVMRQVSDRISATRDEPITRVQAAGAGPVETLQLGAFSSPSAARAAWASISAADASVAALSPAFESVTVDGRILTRLRVSASADAARTICRAADAVDLGCMRQG